MHFPSAWVPHPTGFEGNEAVRLVTRGRKPNRTLGAPALQIKNHLQLLQVLDHIVLVMAMDGAAARMGLE